jgi:glycosyltransferase involved in cell wall biosynthesis
LLIGPTSLLRPEQREKLSLANIRLLGSQPYQALPELLAQVDVAMIPFMIDDLIKATSPIKLYEYLAAGLPVISTPMPEVLPFVEPGVVTCAESAAEFAQAAEELRSTAATLRRQEVARQHTWVQRFQTALTNLLMPTPMSSSQQLPGSL